MKRFLTKPRRKRNYEEGHVLRNILLAVFTAIFAVIAGLFITGVLPQSPSPAATPAPAPLQTSTQTPLETPAPLPLREPAHGTRYDVSITHDSESRSLRCYFKLYYVNDTGDTLYDLCLRLFPNTARSGEEAAYGSLTVDTAALDGQIAYFTTEANGEYLRVPFVRELLPGEYTQLYLSYTMQIPFREASFGWTETAYHLTGVIPTVCGYQNGTWETPAYPGFGEPRLSAFAEYRVTVETASRYTVIAPVAPNARRETPDGTLIQSYTLRQARGFAAVIGSGYVTAEDTTGTPAVTAYANTHAAADALAAEARAMLSFYTERFGAYPYDSITLVCVTLGDRGTVSLPGLVLVSDALVSSSRMPLLRESLSRAAAAQWFHAGVGTNDTAAPWLAHSLSAYAGYTYLQSIGAASEPEPATPVSDINGSILDFPDSAAYTASLTDGGIWLLHTLREKVGDTAFFTALQTYAQSCRFLPADADALTAAFLEAAGQDITPWLTAALKAPAPAPDAAIESADEPALAPMEPLDE